MTRRGPDGEVASSTMPVIAAANRAPAVGLDASPGVARQKCPVLNTGRPARKLGAQCQPTDQKQLFRSRPYALAPSGRPDQKNWAPKRNHLTKNDFPDHGPMVGCPTRSVGRPRPNSGRPTMRRDWAGEGPPAEKRSVAGPCREVQAPIGRPALRPCVGSGRGGRPRPFRDASRGAFPPERFHPRPSRSPENGAAALSGPGRWPPRAFGHFRYPGLCGIALPSGPPSRCPAFPPARHATGSTTWLVGKPGSFLWTSAGRPQLSDWVRSAPSASAARTDGRLPPSPCSRSGCRRDAPATCSPSPAPTAWPRWAPASPIHPPGGRLPLVAEPEKAFRAWRPGARQTTLGAQCFGLGARPLHSGARWAPSVQNWAPRLGGWAPIGRPLRNVGRPRANN